MIRVADTTVDGVSVTANLTTLKSDKDRRDQTIDVPITGDLTLHGVTKRVTVPAQGRWDGRSVQVVAHVPVLFSDDGIEAPSIGGFVSVRDRGELELQLFFDRGSAPSTPSS